MRKLLLDLDSPPFGDDDDDDEHMRTEVECELIIVIFSRRMRRVWDEDEEE